MKLHVDPGIKALIFDLDGTLADTMPLHLEAWRITCREHGFEYPNELFYQLAGLSSAKIAIVLIERFHLQDTIDPENFALQKESVFHDMRDLIKPIIPVVNLVYENFKRIPLAIGSGGNKKAVYETLDTLELISYFDIIIAAEDVNNHKPAPDTFLKCAEMMKVHPGDCLVLEDGDRGFEAARRAGMNVLDITPWHPKTC